MGSAAEAEPQEQGGPARARARPLFRLAQSGALVAVAGLLVLLIWRVATTDNGAGFVDEIRRGDKPPAPAFSLPVIWDESETWPAPVRAALDDGELTLTELEGYPVVVNFWASWCGPCKDEAPLLVAFAEAHAGRVVFLGIDVQDLKSDAQRFLRRYRTNYVSVRDSGNEVYTAYGLTGVPETFYIDRRGRAVAHTQGQLSRETLEDGIAASTEAG